MQINLSSGNYNIVSSGQVFLFGEEDLKIDVIANENFNFSIVLNFTKDVSEETTIEIEGEGNTISLKCVNFSDLGTGSSKPINIATIQGKKLFFMFWSYFEGMPEQGQARSVKYTLFLEK